MNILIFFFSDFLFKFLVIGSAGTGKSCILHQFVEGKCEYEYKTIFGEHYPDYTTYHELIFIYWFDIAMKKIETYIPFMRKKLLQHEKYK